MSVLYVKHKLFAYVFFSPIFGAFSAFTSENNTPQPQFSFFPQISVDKQLHLPTFLCCSCCCCCCCCWCCCCCRSCCCSCCCFFFFLFLLLFVFLFLFYFVFLLFLLFVLFWLFLFFLFNVLFLLFWFFLFLFLFLLFLLFLLLMLFLFCFFFFVFFFLLLLLLLFFFLFCFFFFFSSCRPTFCCSSFRGGASETNKLLPSGLETFVSPTRNYSYETFVSRWFCNLPRKPFFSSSGTNLFLGRNLCFGALKLTLDHPPKTLVFSPETNPSPQS